MVLEKEFILRKLGATGEELFLGLKLIRDRVNRWIGLSQAHYAAQILLRFGMETCAGVQTLMEQKEDRIIREGDVMLDENGKKQYQAADMLDTRDTA